MKLDDLKKFAADLGLARVEAVVTPGKNMHKLTIANVDFYFYHHATPHLDRPDWPTHDIKEYDGWGSCRPDIIQDAKQGHIQGLGRPGATGYTIGGLPEISP